MPEQEAAVSAAASERTVVQLPSDLTNMWHRLRQNTADQIAEEYDEDETPLPVDLELEVEMTVHDREPEVDGDE